MKSKFIEGIAVTLVAGGLLFVCINDIMPSDINNYISNKYESTKKNTVESLDKFINKKTDKEKELGYNLGMPKTTNSIRNLLDKYGNLESDTSSETETVKENTPSKNEIKEEIIEKKYVNGELFERYAYKKFHNMYIQLEDIYSIIDKSELYKDDRKLSKSEIKQIKKDYKKFKADYDEMLNADYPVQDELYMKSLKSYTHGLCDMIENVINNYKNIKGSDLDELNDKLIYGMSITENAFSEYNISIN